MAGRTPDLRIFGEPGINVLELQLGVARAFPKKRAARYLVPKVANLPWKQPEPCRLARQCYPAAISSRSSPHIFSSPYITLVSGLNK
jgi:hypothetical protein